MRPLDLGGEGPRFGPNGGPAVNGARRPGVNGDRGPRASNVDGARPASADRHPRWTADAGDAALASRGVHAAYVQSLRYAEDVRRLYRDLQRGICQSLLGLANALEAKDAYTRGHSERVSRSSRTLAGAFGLEPDTADDIARAGLLHDIGKIGVPEGVLGKAGPLTPSEWELMRRHPLLGADIVAPIEVFAAGVPAIRHHHERWDGSGYPDGLRESAIPLAARIIAVADVWDALTSARPYRPARSASEARRVLEAEAGRTLDPDLVAAFVAGLEHDGHR